MKGGKEMIIGNTIRELRNAKELTMKELGERVGLTESAIGMIERGERNPSIDKLPVIAKALNTTPSLLMNWEDNTKGENSMSEEETTVDISEIRSRATLKLLNVLEEGYKRAAPEELRALAEVANALANVLNTFKLD